MCVDIPLHLLAAVTAAEKKRQQEEQRESLDYPTYHEVLRRLLKESLDGVHKILAETPLPIPDDDEDEEEEDEEIRLAA